MDTFGSESRPDTVAQLPEIIHVGDVLYALYSNPFLLWLKAQNPTPVFDKRVISCQRGYIGHWQVRDSYLWLVGLHAWRDGNYTGVAELFEGKREVVANWYTGPLVMEPSASAISEGAPPKSQTLVAKRGWIVSSEKKPTGGLH